MAAGSEAFVVDVFVIGDSISMQYGPALESGLKDSGLSYARKGCHAVDSQPSIAAAIAALHPPDIPPENGGDSAAVAGYLRLLAAKPATVRCRLLLVNAGLHDIRVPTEQLACAASDRSHRVGEEDYARNVAAILRAGATIAEHTVWVTTTPVVDSSHNAELPGGPGFARFDEDRRRYASLAAEAVAASPGARAADLAALTVQAAVGGGAAGLCPPGGSPVALTAVEASACGRRLVDHVHWDDAMRAAHGAALARVAHEVLRG